MKIAGFDDLLNPALKGKIACGDPANSSSAFQVLMAMLYAKGKDGDPMSPKLGRMWITLLRMWTGNS